MRDKLPGLLDIRLVRLDDGTYLDVPRWESREAADAALEKFAEVRAPSRRGRRRLKLR